MLPLEVYGGVMIFTPAFKDLGSRVTSNLDYLAEDSRIRSGSASFAWLREQFFGCKIVKLAHNKVLMRF